MQENLFNAPESDNFNGRAYLLGLAIILIIRTRQFLKAKRLIEHFEKTQRNSF